jgi:hypothetical protein
VTRSILWSINFFDRDEQARIQCDRLKRHFGDTVHVVLFCNNQEIATPKSLADDVVRHSINSGHHDGVIDAHNVVIERYLDRLDDYDWYVSSHADGVFTSLDVPFRALKEAQSMGCDTVNLSTLHHQNVHRPQDGAIRYVYHDWLAWKPSIARAIYPLSYCPTDVGVEGSVGAALSQAGEKPYVLECSKPRMIDDMFLFTDLMGTSEVLVRNNNLTDSQDALQRLGHRELAYMYGWREPPPMDWRR